MAEDSDHIGARVACLDTSGMLATLVSTTGYHCDVWRSIGALVRDGERLPLDIVIKVYNASCSLAETAAYHKHYRELKAALGEIVPSALFVATRVRDVLSVIVVARAITPWFNLANPANEDEAVPLLRTLPRVRSQLARFVTAGRRWQQAGRVIDLYGLDNLVLDRANALRYIDSFEVFFFPDMLELLDEPDDMLGRRIELSLARLDYLEYVLAAARARRR